MDGKEGKKIQLNYHCFNIQISFISSIVAETKFITLPQRRRYGGWGRPARAGLCRGLLVFPSPLKLSWLIFFFPEQHPFPTFNHHDSISPCYQKDARRRRRRGKQAGVVEAEQKCRLLHVSFCFIFFLGVGVEGRRLPVQTRAASPGLQSSVSCTHTVQSPYRGHPEQQGLDPRHQLSRDKGCPAGLTGKDSFRHCHGLPFST